MSSINKVSSKKQCLRCKKKGLTTSIHGVFILFGFHNAPLHHHTLVTKYSSFPIPQEIFPDNVKHNRKITPYTAKVACSQAQSDDLVLAPASYLSTRVSISSLNDLRSRGSMNTKAWQRSAPLLGPLAP